MICRGCPQTHRNSRVLVPRVWHRAARSKVIDPRPELVGGTNILSRSHLPPRPPPVSRFDQNQFSGWPDALSAPPQEAPKSPGGEGGAPDSTSKEEEEEKDSPTLNLPDKEYIENCRRAIAISLKRAAADRSLVLPPPEREESPSKVKNMLACSLSSSYYYICMATTNPITCLPYRIPACRIALPDNSKSCSSHLACLLSWFRPLHIC